MKFFTRTTSVVYLGCLLLISCNAKPATPGQSDPIVATREAAFSNIVPVTENLNSEIQLSLSTELEATPKKNRAFYLRVDNLTNDSVVFPVDYNIRLFTYQEQSGTWNEIQDTVDNRSTITDRIVLSPHGVSDFDAGLNWFNIVMVQPDINELGNSLEIRVFVIGEIYKDNQPTGEKVGAYVDVELQP